MAENHPPSATGDAYAPSASPMNSIPEANARQIAQRIQAAAKALPGNVRLLPPPANVVDLVPEYRGYEYLVANDEIVIVQPSTRSVVEISTQAAGRRRWPRRT